MKRTTSRRPIRLTESKLRQIIKSILLEGGIPDPKDFPEEDYDQEEVKDFNKLWVKYDPDVTPKGFKPKEGPLHPLLLQRAAEILGCELKLLLIYLPTRVIDEREGILGYDENKAMQYADGFVGVDPDIAGENLNGYVFLDDVDDDKIRYLYTCEVQEEEQEEEQLKMIKNKSLMINKNDQKQKTQENKMRRPTRNPMRLTESKLRQIIRSVINENDQNIGDEDDYYAFDPTHRDRYSIKKELDWSTIRANDIISDPKNAPAQMRALVNKCVSSNQSELRKFFEGLFSDLKDRTRSNPPTDDDVIRDAFVQEIIYRINLLIGTSEDLL